MFSTVASGDELHASDAALHAIRAPNVASTSHAMRGTLGRAPTPASAAREATNPTATGCHCSVVIPPPRSARPTPTARSASGGRTKAAAATRRSRAGVSERNVWLPEAVIDVL
jgi:hypothetical protein